MSTSLIAIQEQISALQLQAKEIKLRETADKIAQIQEIMTAYGITIDQLQGKQAKESKVKSAKPVAAKYQGPHGELWSGRGVSPRWVTALIAEGHSKDEFLISK